MVLSQITSHHSLTISHVISLQFGPLKMKVCDMNYKAISLSGLLTILAFEISNELNFGSKKCILKIIFCNDAKCFVNS